MSVVNDYMEEATMPREQQSQPQQQQGPTETRRFMSVMRKLGGYEKYFHDEIEKNGTINVSTFLFSSLVDLFEHKDLFHKAVTLWKQTQPFLCSRVLAPERTNRYFVYTSDDKIHRSDNISYLYFKTDRHNESIDDCKDYWKLLIEREFTIPIDWKNGPMWRLILLKLKPSDMNDRYDYCFISTATHAIFDGQSAFQSLVNLFRLVENLYTDKFRVEHLVQAKVADSLENILRAYSDRNPIECKVHHVEPFKQPRNFMVKNFYQDRKIYIPVDDINHNLEQELHGAFYSDFDNTEVISLKSLVELSKNSLTKLYFITFNGERLKKFLVKCKQNNAKVTGVFNMMFIIAWRLVYANLLDNARSTQLASDLASSASDRYSILSNTDKNLVRNQPINYSTIVNLRGYLKEIEPDSLAWLCNSLYSRFEMETDLDDDQFWTHKFWEYARLDSESFHERLKKGEQFKLENLVPLNDDESRIHFGLSNLVVPSQIIQSLDLFKIEQLFTTASYRQNWTNDFSYHNMINVNENIFWVISYNSHFIKNEAIKIFVDSVQEIFEIICNI